MQQGEKEIKTSGSVSIFKMQQTPQRERETRALKLVHSSGAHRTLYNTDEEFVYDENAAAFSLRRSRQRRTVL